MYIKRVLGRSGVTRVPWFTEGDGTLPLVWNGVCVSDHKVELLPWVLDLSLKVEM